MSKKNKNLKKEGMKEVLAKCTKSYPDENDMIEFAEGKITLNEVRIYHKGEKHFVNAKFRKNEFFKVIKTKLYKHKIHKLYNNDIATHYREAEFYLFPSDFKSAFAYWVTHQNPFEKSNADKAIDAFSNHIKKLFENVEVPQLFTYEELQSIITEKELYKIPEIAALNKTKPDFIDLGALARNIFFMICREKITQN